MFKREILLTGCAIVLALSGQEARAAEACTATPTCAALGYTVTTCNGFVSLKCPFDTTKLFCGSTCASGYVYGQVTGKCGTKNPDILYSGSTAIGVAVSSNLAVAMTDEGAMTWDNAVAKCKAKTTGGKSWRLPTIDELNTMYNEKERLESCFAANSGSKFQSAAYWSSIEGSSSTTVLVVSMINSVNGYNYKTANVYVRCVFAF